MILLIIIVQLAGLYAYILSGVYVIGADVCSWSVYGWRVCVWCIRSACIYTATVYNNTQLNCVVQLETYFLIAVAVAFASLFVGTFGHTAGASV